MKKVGSIIIVAILFYGCATTSFVEQRKTPVNTTVISEEISYEKRDYNVDNPTIGITFRKKTTIRTDYNVADLYRKEREPTKSILGYIVGGTLAVTGLAIAFNSDSTSVNPNQYRTQGIAFATAGVGITLATYLLGKSKDYEVNKITNDVVASEAPLTQEKINIFNNNNYIKSIITTNNGSVEIDLNDYLKEENTDIDFKIAPENVVGTTCAFTITADFFNKLNNRNKEKRQRAETERRLEEERIKQEKIFAVEQIVNINSIVKKEYSLKKTATLYSKGAMWFLVKTEELSLIVDGDVRVKAINTIEHLKKVVNSQAYLISLGPVNVLSYCKKTGYNDLSFYQVKLLNNLLKAFNYDKFKCREMLTRPTLEESVLDLMRERVLAEKENRLDDFRFGIENSLGVGLRRDLEYASP